MLTTLKKLLINAGKNQAIGEFNIHNLEYLQGVVSGGESMSTPVILGITERPLAYMGMEYVVECARVAARNHSIPVCLHLDHGHNLEVIFEAIKAGFSSVMFDGSSLPLEENIEKTLAVVEKAHRANISVEAELGKLKGLEDGMKSEENVFTDPEEAQYFVKSTGVDALAVAIGTAHGFYEGDPKIDLKRLAAINAKVDIPLVLHGGSGVSNESIRGAIKRGIKKINVGTDLKVVSSDAIKQVFAEEPEEIELINFMKPARKAIEEKVREKIKLFNG